VKAKLLFLLIVLLSLVPVSNADVEFKVPLKIMLPVPGALTISFPWSDNVTVNVASYRQSEYTLISRQTYIIFTTNATDTFNLNLIVNYPKPAPGEYGVRAYSSLLGDYYTTLTLNTSRFIVSAEIVTVPAPHYPTAEEVASAQSKYIASLLEALANKTSLEILEKLENYSGRIMLNLTSHYKQYLNSLTTLKSLIQNLENRVTILEKEHGELTGEIDSLTKLINIFRSEMDSRVSAMDNMLKNFQANTWMSLVIVCIVFIAGILGAVYLGSERGPVIGEISLERGKREVVEKPKGKHEVKFNKALFIVTAATIIAIIYLILFTR